MSRHKNKTRQRKHQRKVRRFGGTRESVIQINDVQVSPTYELVTTSKPGLLLWYMMGTGKTIAAITMILNYPDRPVNIFCPEDITFVWQKELEKFPQIQNNIQFYSFENAGEFFARQTLSGELLIMDEVHNLIYSKIRFSNNAMEMITLIRSSFKRLLLSGTPMYQDMVDLVYMVNIASATDIVPYNVSEFERKYHSTHIHKSASTGYIVPIVKNVSTTAVIAPIATTVAAGTFAYITNLVNPKVFKRYLEPVLHKAFKTGQEIYSAYETPLTFLYNEELNKYIKKYPESFGIGFELDPNKSADEFIRITGEFSGLKYAKIYASLFLIAATTTVISRMIKLKIADYTYLNIQKFTKDISPVILYHQIQNGKNEFFPSSVQKNRIVPYSTSQFDAWLELTQGMLGVNTIRDMDITTESNAIAYSNKLDINVYLERGCVIGNLKTYDGKHCQKFFDILKEARGKRAVFYSQFAEKGYILFMDFLKEQGCDFMFLNTGISTDEKSQVLEQFKNAPGECFLVLHSSYTEGVSILGAQQMHILEPIPKMARKAQLMARVVRYMSHSHLPVKDRTVTIFQWGCTANAMLSGITKMARSIYTWAKMKTPVFFTEKYTTFDQDYSPDEIILKNEAISIADETQIIGILNKNRPATQTCCITYPTAKQEAHCRTTRKSCHVQASE